MLKITEQEIKYLRLLRLLFSPKDHGEIKGGTDKDGKTFVSINKSLIQKGYLEKTAFEKYKLTKKAYLNNVR